LKKKEQAAKAYVAMSGIDTKVLMTSYVEKTLLKVKAVYMILVVWFMYVPRRRYSTPWLLRRKGLSKW